jgi:hypothetical protein
MLRRTVKFTKGPFSYTVELECGHTVRQAGRRFPKRKHCPKCYIANKIVEAKEQHPELFEEKS